METMAGRKWDDTAARNTKTLQVCVSPAEYETLTQLAEQKQTSKSVFVRTLLAQLGVFDAS